MSLKQKLYYNVSVLIFKILNNMLPIVLRDKMEIVRIERQIRLAENIVSGGLSMRKYKF